MNSGTVKDMGFEVGINLGSTGTILINGEAISDVLGAKQDHNTLRHDVFSDGTLYMTLNGDDPNIFITDTEWKSLGTITTDKGNKINFWQRTD